MQRKPDATPDDLVSISEAARILGLSKSTLSRQIASKQVRSHGKKVRLSEVLEDRASNIDLERAGRRSGRMDHSSAPVASNPDATISGPDATISDADATIGDPDATMDEEPVIVDGAVLSYKDARALKETYLARLAKLNFERESGALVDVESVGLLVDHDYAVVRERALLIPGKVAHQLAMQPRAVIEKTLRKEVHEFLAELSEPGSVTEKIQQQSEG